VKESEEGRGREITIAHSNTRVENQLTKEIKIKMGKEKGKICVMFPQSVALCTEGNPTHHDFTPRICAGLPLPTYLIPVFRVYYFSICHWMLQVASVQNVPEFELLVQPPPNLLKLRDA
jgi:hypothetical protein